MTKKTDRKPSKKKQQRNSPAIAVGWGRGASEYRPGIFTKRFLEEHGEGSCADVFYALKEDLRRINRRRVGIGDASIRGCTYNSFAKYWHWFKMLDLIERVDKQEPAMYDFLKEKQFYQLTAMGASEEAAWLDPVRAAHPEFG